MMASSSTTLVLHSGGLDSSLCLLMERDMGREVVSLGINYGQRHIIEMEYAEAFCAKHKIVRHVASIQWPREHKEIPTNRTPEEMRASVSPAFLPGRNLLFLSLAVAAA